LKTGLEIYSISPSISPCGATTELALSLSREWAMQTGDII
jgi:hypothetical protein